jgi:hypothetical protein
MALVVVAAAFPVHGLRVASFVLAIGAFVFLNAATEPARLERWLAAYRVRLIVLFGASIAALAFTAKHFLASMFAWFGMSPEQGTSSFGSLLFTIGLLAQQHFAGRFVLVMKPRQIRSESPHDRTPTPPA